MKNNKKPIGVFDSGVGGLTVVGALVRTLPGEDIVYLGDTARVPYGIKSKETVTRFSLECTRFLEKFGIKLAVIACNTASSFSLTALKKNFDFPVIGVIGPGVEEACRTTENHRIGVIGTKATVRSGAYVGGIKKTAPRARVFQKACPLFVPLVEEKWVDNPVAKKIAAIYLDGLKKADVDTIILGCTHYPLLKGVIKKFFGKHMRIVDSSLSVSNAVKTFLDENNLSNTGAGKGKVRAFVTDDPDSFKGIARLFLKKDISVRKVALS